MWLFRVRSTRLDGTQGLKDQPRTFLGGDELGGIERGEAD
jgi:hypothetical protein